MKQLFPAFILFIFLVSCDSKSDNKEQLAAPSVLPATNSVSSVTNDSAAILKSDAGVTLNPQHGEPGHRCDIAVGAPLNTPVISTSTSTPPTVTTTATPTLTTPVAPIITPVTETKIATPNSNTATVTLNPKHGDPGHRCDIAVGAPLNSKPTQ